MITFKIHVFYWIMAFICGITGYFKNFLLFSLIIIIHEFGHVTASLIYKWKIKKVVILPRGGITIFDEIISKYLNEEFVILIFGPLFQIIFYLIYTYIFGFNQILYNYNLILLLFNLLPIYPLDGYKLLNIILNIFFSFKLSHLISIIISLIINILLVIYIVLNFNLILFFASINLLIRNIKELRNHNILFNKFLLERLLYNINLKKTKIIKSNNLKKMKREYKHIFLSNNKYKTEKEVLSKYFSKKIKD